ncbi:hypothetical protein [uncultured Shimia sp.]|uniref:hypothetical protein n=1 Tax=uncultured Shimia sp. TaxID=573152 RepID=UPI0025FEC8F8|nr:hypothetical protein [uncultured Shimia sp.]
MTKGFWGVACTAILLAGCTDLGGGTNSEGHLTNLSDNLVALAAPHQDLSTVRINPEDGCYEYRHVGPVETTYLPLRAHAGNPLCSRPPE